MSEQKKKKKLNFDVIAPTEIFIKCIYDYRGKIIYPHKIKEARDLFMRVIPQIEAGEGENSRPLYYPVDELRMREPLPEVYEGRKKSLQDTGIGVHYRYMGLYHDMGEDIKRLHNIIAHNINKLKIFQKCEIIWGDKDGGISSSIHDYKAFKDLEDWKELKTDPEILKKNKEKFDKKYP